MANQVFNEAKRALLAGEIDFDTDDIRVLLVMTNTVVDTENDGIATFADFTGGAAVGTDEYDGTNYTTLGIALSNQTVNKDDANDRGEFDSTDAPSWTALGAGTRDCQGLVVYKFVTNLAASIPIAYIDQGGGFPFTGNGSNVTINFNAEGIIQAA